jgi:hypothetical protein
MRHGVLRYGLCLLALSGAGCPNDDCTPTWHAVTEDADGALLAAWGNGDDDVYAVGGGLGVSGQTALALHWDGSSWTRLATGDRAESLWWVWGIGADVWMVGENGLVLRWNGTAASAVDAGTTAKLWGVWGASSDDVWIVGGTPGTDGPDDVVLHWNGATLAVETVPARGAALFKVWGSSAADVWVSGENGTLLHKTAAGWEDLSSELATNVSLFTVHGCAANDVYVVGGRQVWKWDGAAFTDLEADPGAPVNGVSCGEREVLVVGNGAVKLRLDKASGVWTDEQFVEPTGPDFHGAWISPSGDAWAVGGDFLTPSSGLTRRPGAIAVHGCDPPGAP